MFQTTIAKIDLASITLATT